MFISETFLIRVEPLICEEKHLKWPNSIRFPLIGITPWSFISFPLSFIVCPTGIGGLFLSLVQFYDRPRSQITLKSTPIWTSVLRGFPKPLFFTTQSHFWQKFYFTRKNWPFDDQFSSQNSTFLTLEPIALLPPMKVDDFLISTFFLIKLTLFDLDKGGLLELFLVRLPI